MFAKLLLFNVKKQNCDYMFSVIYFAMILLVIMYVAFITLGDQNMAGNIMAAKNNGG